MNRLGPSLPAALLLGLLTARVAEGQPVLPPSRCGNSADGVRSDGRLLCLQTPSVSLRTLVERAAPLLWFSPDEHLLAGGTPGRDTPAALPFDREGPGEQAVVYVGQSRLYTKTRGRPFAPMPAGRRASAFLTSTEEIDVSVLEALTLEYYFYYPRDLGFGGHPHDLEQLTVKLVVVEEDPGTSGCRYAVYFRRAEGWAHGSVWYHNVLEVDSDGSASDYSFPLTLLVEEGKHAVAPDRNGDGHYTPGYDVNRRTNDAWGVRDTLRNEDLAAPRYSSAQTKPRVDTERIGPALTATTPECLYSAYRRNGVDGRPKAEYRLRVVPLHTTCDVEANRRFDLCATMRRRRAGEQPEVAVDTEGTFVGWALGLQKPSDRRIDRGTFGYRLDGSVHEIVLVYPFFTFEMPRVGGWVAPRLNLAPWSRTRLGSVDVSYTPSVSRWLDWYGALGVNLPPGRGDRAVADPARMEMEVGLRVRFKAWGGFNGFRLGTRWAGFEHIHAHRMVLEATLGPW